MKKFIVLFSGMIIAAGAAAQADRTGSNAVQAGKAGIDRQVPVENDPTKRENAAKEPPESANIVDPDFQGSSKQETTASGMGQPKQKDERAGNATRTGSSAQDAEDKTKK